MFIPMILVLINTHLKPRAALLYPGRRFAAVSLDQTRNIADAPAFGDNPRLSEKPGGQLRNRRCPLCNSMIFPSNTFDRQVIGIFSRHVLYLLRAHLRFQDRGEFVSNVMARIAFAVTADSVGNRPALEPKLQRFTYHRRPMRDRSSSELRLLARYHAPMDAFNRVATACMTKDQG
jgi:hypothetical protein